MDLTSYWDGGSRSYFQVLELATGKAMGVPQNGTPFDNGRNFQNVEMPAPGFAVVERSIFLGKESGLHLHLHPENAAKFLPAPTELTADGRIVLDYTATRKSSYAGKNRQQMANEDNGITLERWNVASDSLKSKGLLNKSGAITVAGKNARVSR